jgi:hypothetical protein
MRMAMVISGGWRLVRGSEASAAPRDDFSFEGSNRKFRIRQRVVETGDLLFKEHFRLIPFRREGGRRKGETVVGDRQLGQGLSRDVA